MRARLLDDWTLIVPVRAEGDDGLIGDGALEIRPEDREYEAAVEAAIAAGDIAEPQASRVRYMLRTSVHPDDLKMEGGDR